MLRQSAATVFSVALCTIFFGGCATNGVEGALVPERQSLSSRPFVTNTHPKYLYASGCYAGKALYELCEFTLPLRNGQSPSAIVSGVPEPIPIAEDESELLVGSFDSSAIYSYDLPLSRRSIATRRANAEEPNSMVSTHGYLYVATANQVMYFKLPLRENEKPVVLITGAPGNGGTEDWFVLAANNKMIFVQDYNARTIRGYALPATAGAKPQFTISNTEPGALAADPDGERLFSSSGYAVLSYSLPYVSGEVARTLNVSEFYGGPVSLAAQEGRLFISTSGFLLSYKVPFAPRDRPNGVIDIPGIRALLPAN